MKKRLYLSFLLLCSGCWSTHPFLDIRDCLHPGKMYKDRVTPYGGVCIPNQGVQLPIYVDPIAVPIGGPPAPAIPPPAPLPPPPGAVQVPVVPGGIGAPPPPPAVPFR